MLAKLLRAAALVSIVVPGLSACGLIDPDVTHFDLGLPDKQFTVVAGNWGLSNPEALMSAQCTASPETIYQERNISC